MRVCYFGIYNPEYSRNKILISGLRANGVEVFECQTNKKGFSKYFDLIKKHKVLKNDYGVMVVGYPGFQAMILAKFLTKKPIIFDAFVSIYDSIVLDRAQVSRYSPKALYFWCLDKISMSLADVVLFDTNEHIGFVSKEFGIDKSKFKRIFVGADTAIFYPRGQTHNNLFKVINYGHYVPLQGMEYIIKSAKLLSDQKDIIFEIIGDGGNKEELQNVLFVGNVSLSELSEKAGSASLCLGIFGHTAKTQRVIPNKVYECVALKKPVITGDTPAIRELFDDSELFLIPTSSPEAIAKAILEVKSNIDGAKVRAEKAYNKLINVASVDKLGLGLKNIISNLIKR